MEIAAGLFLINAENKFLVGHPTNHSPNFWSIPKGRVEDGENNIDAAVRETFEETNVDVSDWSIIHNLQPQKYKSGKKILYPFVLFEKQNKINFDKFNLKCNSNVPIEIGGFLEMDDFSYITLEEGRKCLHETQINCLDEIETIIKKIRKNKNQ